MQCSVQLEVRWDKGHLMCSQSHKTTAEQREESVQNQSMLCNKSPLLLAFKTSPGLESAEGNGRELTLKMLCLFSFRRLLDRH